jgi:hypothetical protein
MKISKDNDEKILSYKGVNLKFLENGLFIIFGYDNDTYYGRNLVYSCKNYYIETYDAKKEYNISYLYWRLIYVIFMLILPSIYIIIDMRYFYPSPAIM